MSFLQKLSLFPYNSFWRISGKTEVNNKCAGFISLLLIMAFVAIALSKMIEVFKMTTIFASQQTYISPLPSFINMTTSYTDPSMDQFMFGIRPASYGDANNLELSDFDLVVFYMNQTYDSNTKSYKMSYTDELLQKCTSSHFFKLSAQNNNVKNWDQSDLWCLPINRTYELGGTELGSWKYLTISAMCKTANCKNLNYTLVFEAYTLNTFINSINGSNPFTSYMNTYEMTVETYRRSRNFLYLNKNILKTDNSLLPFTQQSTLVGFQTSAHEISYSYPTINSSYGQFSLYYSGTNVVHSRYYLKLLDAFAYLGGVFSALIGAFFFMNIFSTFFFQIEFAQKLLRESKLKKTTFMTHFKQAIFSILAIFKQPQWQTSKYISSLRTTVNNLLDIVYIQRRLQFLEKGMEVLLEKHHLKGLYLVHEVTKEAADTNFQNYEINNKFSQYLKEKSKSKQKINYKLRESLQSAQNLKGINQLRIADNFIKSDQNIERKGEDLSFPKTKKVQNINDHKVLSQRIGRQNNQDDCINLQSYSMKEEDLKDLLKLCREAKEKEGETRSSKIYEKIDEKVKEALQEMLDCELPRIRTVLSF